MIKEWFEIHEDGKFFTSILTAKTVDEAKEKTLEKWRLIIDGYESAGELQTCGLCNLYNKCRECERMADACHVCKSCVGCIIYEKNGMRCDEIKYFMDYYSASKEHEGAEKEKESAKKVLNWLISIFDEKEDSEK